MLVSRPIGERQQIFLHSPCWPVDQDSFLPRLLPTSRLATMPSLVTVGVHDEMQLQLHHSSNTTTTTRKTSWLINGALTVKKWESNLSYAMAVSRPARSTKQGSTNNRRKAGLSSAEPSNSILLSIAIDAKSMELMTGKGYRPTTRPITAILKNQRNTQFPFLF